MQAQHLQTTVLQHTLPPSRARAPRQLTQRNRPLCQYHKGADGGPRQQLGKLISAEVQLPNQVLAGRNNACNSSLVIVMLRWHRPQRRVCPCRAGRRRNRAAEAGKFVKLPFVLLQGQSAVAGVADPDYINRQLMEILAPKTDYLAVGGAASLVGQ